MNTIAPSLDKTAFNCPHCKALAHQYWFTVFAKDVDTDDKLPVYWSVDRANSEDLTYIDDQELEESIRKNWLELANGKVDLISSGETKYVSPLLNVFLSKCFACNQVSIWRNTQIIYPSIGGVAQVNPDTPSDIKRDYEEASSILNKSPRGAAALLRLAIQKLFIHLGKPGKNINADIGSLVSEGLDVRLQQALDVLRVLGNEAVHPGQIDLRDDREAAEGLFKLFNLIVDKLISEPKQIAEVYSSLPKDKLKGISERDKR